MARIKPILIACPQYRTAVRGTYDCEPDGSCPRGLDGKYMLHRVRCSQHGGRCMQTLCALHRYNNRGPESWYPKTVLALPDVNSSCRRRRRKAGGEPSPNGSSVSVKI